MTQSISLAYGNGHIAFTFERPPDILKIQEPTATINGDRFLRRLNAFLEKSPIDLHSPAVVVADKTRLCGYDQYLTVLLDALISHGADADDITIYIAYGTHARQSDAEGRRNYGAAYQRFHWVHHDCTDAKAFMALGRTQRRTPVRIRRDIKEAGGLITFGAIAHHYFAGFGGGRKLVFPGLGERQAVYANHGLLLDRDKRCLASGCQPGLLDGNPLAEDLAEYESHCPADMAIHGVLDSRGRVCDLLVGSGSKHFRKACARHGSYSEVETDDQYDLVLASCGGFPKDINFIQSHKAVHHAAAFVRDGGRLIVLAQCADQIGSQTFLPWFELGDQDAAFDRLAAQYVGNGGTALAMMAKLKRIRIGLVTALDQKSADCIGFERLSPQQAQQAVEHHCGSLAVIPNASMLVKANKE